MLILWWYSQIINYGYSYTAQFYASIIYHHLCSSIHLHFDTFWAGSTSIISKNTLIYYSIICKKKYSCLQGEDVSRTRQWFKALQFYGLSLGNWRRRRNGMANIMIYGTSSTNASKTMSSPMTNTEASKSTSALFVPKSSSLSQLVDLSPWSCGYEDDDVLTLLILF